MKPSFELFQHTADMGIRLRASSRAEIVQIAAKGLYAVVGELVPKKETRKTLPFCFSGPDCSILLRDYLAELLYLLEHKSQIVSNTRVQTFTDSKLAGELVLENFDQDHSNFHTEVKAITYHQLAFVEKRSSSGEAFFEAAVIVDL